MAFNTTPGKRVLVLGDVPIYFKAYAKAYRLDINDIANALLQGVAYVLSNEWDANSDRDENFSMAIQDYLYWEYELAQITEEDLQHLIDRWEEIIHSVLVNNRLDWLIRMAESNGLDVDSCRDRFKARVVKNRLEIEFLR
ncbi:hypothetical protein CPT_Moabite_324 [Serratia phage Moabite]|uniref:Uncharacterized protein n=2 Tax=Moabitevirus moabite TaxID=2846181 RepID=A0A7T3NBT3_9CAUD|nr:hypothetical protein HWC48_gp092 [Serratia phage Moabite]QDB71354.1 hypothetical protein CPT_Moabite_324 [Serratia phage Moabite]QPX76830.1 hypothetical protein [Serratia phage vB_SmaM_Yaphecito]UQT03712.1 hypothetical protein KODAMA_02450 [Serratia phage vB_SmaM-Kodama]